MKKCSTVNFMAQTQSFFKSLILATLIMFLPHANVFAGLAPPPEPPAENPHPPVSAEDKNRVAFAELAIKTLLTPGRSKAAWDPVWNPSDQTISFGLKKTCLQNPACLRKNDGLQRYIGSIHKLQKGALSAVRHVHIVPWAFQSFEKRRDQGCAEKSTDLSAEETAKTETAMSPINLKGDEYLIHAYARFAGQDWYHLDVVVSESAAGELEFEKFYIIEMPRNAAPLPVGVVC